MSAVLPLGEPPLQQSLLKAEAASRAKTEFLSRMSHELRTPLNAVLGFAQLLRAMPMSPLQQDYLAQIERAGWHLAELISDVLDVARIESGRVALTLAPLSAHRALEEAWQLCLPSAQEQGLQAQPLFLAQPELQLRADGTRLRQVLMNVLSNAIKYNRPGGRLSLSVRRQGQRALIEIEDTGLGMDELQCQHLFEPFNRLGREHSGVPGTGIGLVLSRELLQLMGGDILVRSRPGEGSCVSLLLPLAECQHGSAASVPRPEAQVLPLGAELRGSVLCVEDNEVNMLLVEQLLRQWPGLQMLKAVDGREALALAREHRPSLVLLDMCLPDMDGLQVLQALRADPLTRELPVVVLSADAALQDQQRARQAGALDYWTKPLDFQQFRARLPGCLKTPSPAG